MKVVKKIVLEYFVFYISTDYVLGINQRLLNRWLTTTRYLKFQIIVVSRNKMCFLKNLFLHENVCHTYSLIQLCQADFMKLGIYMYIVTYKLKHSTYKNIH